MARGDASSLVKQRNGTNVSGQPDQEEGLKPFGRVFKELRLKSGLSQQAVASKAEVSTGYIGLIETGQRGAKPSQDVVKRIALALGANIDETEALLRAAGWLGEHESLMATDRPTVEQIIDGDRLLDAEGKHLLLAMYRRLTRGASHSANGD